MINLHSQRCESKGGIVLTDIGFELQTVRTCTIEKMQKFLRWIRKGREIDLVRQHIPNFGALCLDVESFSTSKWRAWQ